MTSHQQTLAVPPGADVSESVRTVSYLLSILAVLSAAWLRLRSWRRRRQEQRATEAQAIRYVVDAIHHLLRVINGGTLPPDELRRQEALLRKVRRDLARRDGHLELLAEVDADEEREVLRWATRTQRIQARKDEIKARVAAPEDPR